MRKMGWLILALLLTSCSVLPLGDLAVGNLQETEVVAECPACPTCPAPVCPTCPVLPTLPAATETPESNPTPTEPAATETETPTLSPTETKVPTKTSAPTLTPTQTTSPTLKPTNTTVPSDKPFQVQPNSPVYLQNFAHTDFGCQWMGVAGQVFDLSGKPMLNQVVVVEGFLNNKLVDSLTLTGLSMQYGPGGYEIKLGNSAIASTNSLFVTLYDLSGKALSLPVIIDTYADCNKNLIILNFQKVK